MDGREWYLKASFDKANRTRIDGGRGTGFSAGCDIFQEFKAAFPHVNLLTDVHECAQVEPLAGFIDCVQVPAFLSRQTDLLVECGRHFSKVNIKKGQWLSPDNILGAVDKVKRHNSSVQVWLCERGSQFGYEQLVIDFRSVPRFRAVFDRVLLDCTHSTQYTKPNGRNGGDRNLAEKYMIAAPIFGYDGVFAEVHPCPPEAVSDGECQIYLDRIAHLIQLSEQTAIVAGEL